MGNDAKSGQPQPVPTYLEDLCHRRATGAQARGLIYRALCRAALRSAKCPQDAVLAEMLGLESMSTVTYHIRELERRNMILCASYQRGRQITIVATGKSTRPIVGGTPHWRTRRGLVSVDSRWKRADAGAVK